MRDDRKLTDIPAKSVFQSGDKVEVSVIGLIAGLCDKPAYPTVGVVVGFSR